MNSKKIGNIGEAKVLAKFVEHGFPVYLPFGDNERSDMIAEFNGKLNRIQVKTAVGSKNGRIEFDLTSSSEHRNGGCRKRYYSSEIDYFALYSVERDKIYLVKAPDNSISSIVIRYLNTANGQKQNVHMEDEFLFENVILNHDVLP